MFRRFLFLAAALICTATVGASQGCPAKKGEEFPGIEALNQLLLNADFQGFSAAVADGSGGGILLDMTAISQVFPTGFSECTTIAQRFEPQGTMQSIVVFRSDIGPLFAYWLVLPTSTGFTLNSISLDTNVSAILNLLK